MRTLEKEVLTDFDTVTLDGVLTEGAEVGITEHMLYLLALHADNEHLGELEWLMVSRRDYNELDAAGLTHVELLALLYNNTTTANNAAMEKYDSSIPHRMYNDIQVEVQSDINRAYKKRINDICSKSSLNGRLAVAAGVLYGLSNKFIESTSMVEFFLFYCDINYDLRHPSFSVDDMLENFAQKEIWNAYIPYIHMGFTNMELVGYAIDNDIDPSLLSSVESAV